MSTDDRFALQCEVAAVLATSITQVSEWPGPDVRPSFAALVRGLASERECQRAYFWLKDWATELEAMARACSLRAVALSAVNSPDDPRR